jgi:P2-related tail formation protein
MAIKARDLRVAIKDQGFEQAVVHTLELVIEQNAEARRNMQTLSEVVEGCVRQIEMMIKIGTGMREIIQDLQRITRQGDTDDQNGQE